MATIERIGSFEKIGDWWRVQIAVNGRALAPLWLCAPEFAELEAAGDENFWRLLARKAVVADAQARDLLPSLIPTKEESDERAGSRPSGPQEVAQAALRFIPPKGGWPQFSALNPVNHGRTLSGTACGPSIAE